MYSFLGEILASLVHEALLYTLSYLVTVPITLFSRNSYSERPRLRVTQLNSGSVRLGAEAFPIGTHSLLGQPPDCT